MISSPRVSWHLPLRLSLRLLSTLIWAISFQLRLIVIGQLLHARLSAYRVNTHLQYDSIRFVEVNLYGGANSHINSQSLASSSFAHRDKLLNFQMYASSPTYGNPYPSSGIDFVNGMYESLVGPMRSSWGITYGAYVNYGELKFLSLSAVR